MKVPEHLKCDAHATERVCKGEVVSYRVRVECICEGNKMDGTPYDHPVDLCESARASLIQAIQAKCTPITRDRKTKPAEAAP